MKRKVEEGIDPTSVGIVLEAIAVIAIVTGGAFVLKHSRKALNSKGYAEYVSSEKNLIIPPSIFHFLLCN